MPKGISTISPAPALLSLASALLLLLLLLLPSAVVSRPCHSRNQNC
jgi:hypothetical protein